MGPSRVACSYKDCKGVFGTESDMIAHKVHSPEHWYCKKCNLDTDCEETLLAHKILSPRHIVCPTCGMEFKSDGGRNIHVAQAHRAEQRIVCPGCDEIFTSAGALINHIEKSMCKGKDGHQGITREVFEEEKAKKQILKKVNDEVKGSNKAFSFLGTEAPTSVDGGVALEPGDSLIDSDNTAKSKEQGTSGFPKEAETSSSRAQAFLTSREHWPKLGADKYPVKMHAPAEHNTTDEDDKDADLMKFTELSIMTKAFPALNWKSPFSDVPTNNESRAPSVKTSESDDYQKWDPFRFFNGVTAKFECRCGEHLDTRKAFEQHLATSPKHVGGTARCPACLRIFKNTAALVQHCESATTRCKINASREYQRLMKEITAGVVDTAGHHIDGSVKLMADKEWTDFVPTGGKGNADIIW